MFMLYTSLFEQFYRSSMLIADIKSQTKGVHFSQKLQDAHEKSF